MVTLADLEKKKKKRSDLIYLGSFQELCHRFLSFSFPLGVGEKEGKSLISGNQLFVAT